MKRLLLISAVLGGAALLPSAAQAQRGGHGGGGHGGGGVAMSHAGGGFSRPAGMGAVGGMRGGGVRMGALPSRIAPGRRSFLPNNRVVARGGVGNSRLNRFNNGRFFCNGFGDCDADDFFFRDRFRDRFFFNNCFNGFGGFGCGFNPFLSGNLGWGLWDPFWDFYNQPQQQQQQQPVVVESNEGGNRELAFEMQALRDEIQAMRSEEIAREQARNAPPARPTAQEEANAVLVFRDGRQLSVRNYAIADHTIWVLGPNNARKVQVSELDVPATEQANEKNGVEFHLPH